MGFFRKGFWQKLIIYLTVIFEFALVASFIIMWAGDLLSSDAAIIFILIYVILNFTFGVMITLSDSEDSYKIAWLFIVGMLPILGHLFYLFFAHKYRSKAQRRYFREYFSIISHNEERNL